MLMVRMLVTDFRSGMLAHFRCVAAGVSPTSIQQTVSSA